MRNSSSARRPLLLVDQARRISATRADPTGTTADEARFGDDPIRRANDAEPEPDWPAEIAAINQARSIRPGADMLSAAQASIDQGAEMRAAFMSIEEASVTYLEGMTLASQNAELGDPGACRRR